MPSVRLALIAVVCSAALFAGIADAQACSFQRPVAAAYLERHDAAFIGALVEKHDAPRAAREHVMGSADPAIYVFRVESVAKGNLPAVIEVVSARDGASCGLETPIGQRVGLFLDRDGELWRSNLPLLIAPVELAQAAADAKLLLRPPLPAAGGGGSGGRVVWGTAVAVALGVAAAGAILVRRRSRPARA
jgi:hypothetical protein